MTTLVKVAALRCGYRGRPVLSGVDLALAAGRLVCVIGPNGAGKTTLVRTIAGLLPALGGSVAIHGRDLTTIAPRERARMVSVVLTSTHVPGHLTVRGLVELGRIPHTGLLGRLTADDHRVVAGAMEMVGISHIADRHAAEVSDGERQRAAVARALAQAADVVILDEPTAFLDVAGRATVMTSLQRIAHDAGRLVIATSHDVELVLRTADMIVVIDERGTIATGSPEDLALSGQLAALYPADTLVFDAETGRFRLPERDGPHVRVTGTGVRAFWTAHALERIGYTVDAGNGKPVAAYVDVRETDWLVSRGAESWTASTIMALADRLR
jgi:iron complex transport system ATP-binding protein